MTYNKKQSIIVGIIIFLSTIILTVGAMFLYKKSYGDMLCIGVLCGFFSLFLTFSFYYELMHKVFDYDNAEHLYRFLIVYEISLVLSLLYPFSERSGWMFVALCVSLSLFSNSTVSVFASTGLIGLTTLLSGQPDVKTFIVHFLSAMIAITLFRSIDEYFKVSFSIFMSVVTLFVLETAGFIFLENKELSFEQFIMPIVNVAINTIVLFWILKYFNDTIANRYRNKYLELNDQEYHALAKLKEVSKEEYLRSIHTAYLAERISLACGCNVDMAKNLAYYHRIKKSFDFDHDAMVNFVKENNFPPEAAETVVEFSDKTAPLIKKEACIVYLSDKLISSIMQIFATDNQKKVDYGELIDTLLDKHYIKNALGDSDMTQRDLRNVREIMKRETLYYDFLR